MKSLPLYLGGLLVAAAIAGAAMSLLTPAQPAPAQPAPQAQAVSAPAARVVAPAKVQAGDVDALSPEQVKAQDEEDIIKILLAQIEATPSDIDPAWLKQMCQQISDPDSLDAFWNNIVASGASYGLTYVARNQKAGTVMSRNPLYYVFEAREFIYSTDPQEKRLLGPARGLLDMAVSKSWDESRQEIRQRVAKEQRKKVADVIVPEGEGFLDDEVKTTYFKERLKLYEVLSTLEGKKRTGDPRKYMSEQVRLHEAAIVDRYTRLVETIDQARTRYKQTAQSSAPVTVQISRWTNAVNEHLLALGKIYVEAALAEKAYRGRMQDYANLGFKALAMVYQRSKSGEALRVMREANRIQRYNLWQMARVAWKDAKALAEANRMQEAEDKFLTAKNLYLQCMSRLERSKKPAVFEEYRRLQADITTWVTSRRSETAATAG